MNVFIMDTNVFSKNRLERCSQICNLCLSSNRSLREVCKSVLLAYSLMTNRASIQDVLICWECSKRLKNVQQFKLQVKQANDLLEAYRNDPAHPPQCLSNLTQITKNTYDNELIENVQDTNICEPKIEIVKDEWFDNMRESIWIKPEFIPNIEFDDIDNKEQQSQQYSDCINYNLICQANIKENFVSREENAREKKENAIEIKESDGEVTFLQNKNINTATSLHNISSVKHNEVIIHYSGDAVFINCGLNTEQELAQRKDTTIKSEDQVIVTNDSDGDDFCNEHIANVAISENKFPSKIMIEKNSLSSVVQNIALKSANQQQGFSTTMTEAICRVKHKKINKNKRQKKICSQDNKKEFFDYFKAVVPTKKEYDTYVENYFKLRKSNFKCMNCIKSMKTHAILQAHMKKFHYEGEEVLRCDECVCSFMETEQIILHKQMHKEFRLYTCLSDGCSYVHHRKDFLKQHVEWHKKRQEDRYRTETYECDVCGVKYNERRKMFIHIKTHRKLCVCETCGFTTSTQYNLNLHKNSHLGPEHRKFVCSICNKRFVIKSHLQQHERIHSGEKTPCEICGCAFTNKYKLKKHRLKMHNIVSETRAIVNTPRTKSLFNNRSIKEIRTGKNDKLTNNKKMQMFKERPSTLGERPKKILYDCLICNKIIKRAGIESHYYVHTDERPLECAVCNKRFKNKAYLAVHMACHSEERKFKCDVCGARFKKGANLYSHKLTHRSEKPHGCSVCEAKFALKGNLTAHMKIHTNDKPFECAVCGKRYVWRKDLVAHSKVHPGMNVFKNSSDAIAD